jgi:hypothetical protein
MIDLSGARFQLGQLVVTRGVRAWATDEAKVLGLEEAIVRHATGDWGVVSPGDAELNEEALRHGGRLLSAYVVADRRIWIITEADRSATTLLFPEEY